MEQAEAIVIRPGNVDDTVRINAIFNHYVLHTATTFDIKPWSDDRRRKWIHEFASPYFLLVAEMDGNVMGFSYNSKLRPKDAYAPSTEVTVYTDPKELPSGIGTKLYQALFTHLDNTALHRAYAIVALPNDASIALHEKFGFKQVGLLHEVGAKFGQWIDVAWYEKSLPTGESKLFLP